MSGNHQKINKKTLYKSLRGPWVKLRYKINDLIRIIKEIIQYLDYKQQEVGHIPWDPQQKYYVAKAIAIYQLMTKGARPKMKFHKHYLELKGIGGTAYILYRPIKYKGPFTRGYRYIQVSVPTGTYKIIKIKKRKVKKKEKNEKLDKFLG